MDVCVCDSIPLPPMYGPLNVVLLLSHLPKQILDYTYTVFSMCILI